MGGIDGSRPAAAVNPDGKPGAAWQTPAGITPTVRALGAVSLLTDVSSEMVYPVNPVFITQVLGAPPWAVGIIEGIAESEASLLKLYSGWLSDRKGYRKPFALAGYGVAAFAKPLIALATSWGHVLLARVLDRMGKGIRSAPRDALIAENCAPELRGRAFGFHRSMDTAGAVIGPFLGYLLLQSNSTPQHLRWLYLIAFIPALLGVLVLAFFVREKVTRGRNNDLGGQAQPEAVLRSRFLPSLSDFRTLSPAYRWYLLVVGIFSLGNSSDAFLLLRAGDMGVDPRHLLLLYATFNVVEALLAYGAGSLTDRIGRRPVVAAGYLVFAAVYLGFALLHGPAAVWGLFMGYGLYYTFTQGAQRALAADLARPERRAADLGMFHMIVGLCALPASLAAGWLYTLFKPAPFLLGAGAAALATTLLVARPTSAKTAG